MSRFRRIITAFLALAAVATSAPTAFAMRQPIPGLPGAASSVVRYAYDRPDRHLIPITSPSQAVQAPQTAPQTAPPATGFSGVDVLIAVGAVLALTLLAMTGLAVAQGRTRRGHRPAAVTH